MHKNFIFILVVFIALIVLAQGLIELIKLIAKRMFSRKPKFILNSECCEGVSNKYKFAYARITLLSKNPKLTYRENGDVDYDPYSSFPQFVDYNNIREIIRQAKLRGENHIHCKMSVAASEQIRKDGYTDHNDEFATISW
jgi:hypothetical protein